MADKINIDLDEQFLNKFFGLTERIIPDDQEITLLMLKRQLEEIEEMLINIKIEAQEQSQAGTSSELINDEQVKTARYIDLPEPTPVSDAGSVLIIDDLGVITYQLSVLFKKFGYEPTSSKEIYDAIEKYKKQTFDLVIMDLYIPTEREGFILLDELKKITVAKKSKTIIGVMSASPKKDHKQMCKNKGAQFYVEKIDDWQKELLAVVNDIRQ